MIRFEEPEIKVVKFATEDVYTLSGGYAGTGGYGSNIDDGYVSDLFHNSVMGGNDEDIPL